MRKPRDTSKYSVPRLPSLHFAAETRFNTHQYTKTTSATGAVTVTVNRGVNTFGANTISRVSDPNWKVKVVKKQDATNPYSKVIKTGYPLRISGSLVVKQPLPFVYSRSEGFLIYAPVTPVQTWTDNGLKDLALKRLKAKINDNVGVFDAVVPLVELRELRSGCISLIDSASDAAKKTLALLASKGLRGKALHKSISSLWLQWSFGIKPVLNDIRNANEAISTFLTRSDHIVRLEAGAMRTRNHSEISPGTAGLSGATVTGYATGKDVLVYKYVGAFDLKVSSSNDYSASNVFGIEPSTVLSTLYELTPYSWLLDYFTSVGDFLNDTFELPSGSTVYLSLTEVRSLKTTLSAKYVPSPGVIMTSESCARGSFEYKSVNRSRLTALPRLGLRIKTLDELSSNGFNKLANLTSVLSQLSNGGRLVYLRD